MCLSTDAYVMTSGRDYVYGRKYTALETTVGLIIAMTEPPRPEPRPTQRGQVDTLASQTVSLCLRVLLVSYSDARRRQANNADMCAARASKVGAMEHATVRVARILLLYALHDVKYQACVAEIILNMRAA